MKLFFIILCFVTHLLALPIELDKEKKSIKQAEILHKNISINEAIKNKDFTLTNKLFTKIRTTFKSDYWIKIPIKNIQSKEVDKSIFFIWKNANIDIYLKKKNKLLGPFSIEDKSKNGIFSKSLTLNSLEKVDIYIHVKKSKLLRDFKSIFITNSEGYLDVLIEETKWIYNGFFIGFLLCMLFFGLVWYLSTALKSYLYFSIFLFFIILIFSNTRWYIFEICGEYSYPLFLFYRSIIVHLVIISLIQFTREFFNTKEYFPTINLLLKIYIIICIVSAIGASFNFSLHIYPTLGMPLLMFTAFISYPRYKLSAIFYSLGILFLFPPMMLYRSLILEIDFNFHYIMQISNFICSIWIGFATYLHLKQIVKDKLDYEKQSCIQSRFTVMGETIANIAHQWRQPLNQLATIIATIQMYEENKKLTSKVLNSKLEESKLQLKHMSSTIDDFMSFFAQKKGDTKFSLHCFFKDIIALINSSLKNNNITLTLNVENEKMILSNEDQLKQVILIILTNAKDALKESTQKNKKIIVSINEHIIKIEDNAGGIPKNIIDKVFDAYFSTKENKNGTGLGLYTAKNIVQNNLNGNLEVVNKKDGACFIIDLSSKS